MLLSTVKYTQPLLFNLYLMCNALSRSLLMTVGLLLISAAIFSQNYIYSLSTDSSSYTSLSGATTIAGTQSWLNKSFGLRLPFQFNLCGTPSDSITIDNNGFINFQSSINMSLVAFNSYTANKDTNNVYVSLISQQLEGTSGNRILKIQFANLSENNLSALDYLNYQVWLYENGNKIEFHIGANARAAQQNAETAFPVLMGILNRNMDGENSNGYLVTGAASSPTGLALPSGEGLQYINATPASGIIYRFTPAF